MSQEGDRVKMRNGLPTPVDSFSRGSTLQDKSTTPNLSLQKAAPLVNADGERIREVEHLGRGYMAVKTRRRVTVDGGRSLLATERSNKEPQSEGELLERKGVHAVTDCALSNRMVNRCSVELFSGGCTDGRCW